MFAGFVDLAGTLKAIILVEDTSDVPIDADALPTYRVYGPNGFVESGTVAFLDSGTLTGATNATPIVITFTAHGLTTGARIKITGVVGNTAANGTFIITKINSNTFSLDGSVGNGAYVSGGAWHVVGAYSVTINALASSGYEASENYSTLFNFNISSTAKGDVISFGVI